MKRIAYIAILTAIFSGCEKKYEAIVPDTKWDLFESTDAVAMNSSSRNAMEGVYTATDGANKFGSKAVVKWSSTRSGNDTLYHMSVFMESDVTYILCEGKRIDSLFIFNGYWRKMLTTETGIARFTIDPSRGGRALMTGSPLISAGSITLDGVYSDGENFPSQRLVLNFERQLNPDTSFLIMAHRGGGRSSDVLPASENSVEMVRLASGLGATGIEIDVRLTSDNVPIIYHDNNLNDRLIQSNGMSGPIDHYSYPQLLGLVRLINGEKIPTLSEMLYTVVYETNLKFVWLDIKFDQSLGQIEILQKEYMQKAVDAGRQLTIVIGIPDEDVRDNFNALPDHLSTPSLCELSIDDVRTSNSLVWAARWTAGLQESDVAVMHSEGRKVFAWTLDEQQYIQQFITDGHFDALLTNYPSALAYYHYVHQ